MAITTLIQFPKNEKMFKERELKNKCLTKAEIVRTN